MTSPSRIAAFAAAHAVASSFALCAGVLAASAPDSGGTEFRLSGSGETGGVAGEVPGACGSVTLTQSVSYAPGAGVGCGTPSTTSLNGWARAFAIAPGANFVVNCVDFGVDVNTGPAFTVTVNVFTGVPTGPYGALVLRGSLPVTVPAGAAATILKADFAGAGSPVVVPGGSTMVVEVLAPSRFPADGGDGFSFFMGANAAGQTGPSYLRAPSCGAANFVDMAGLGFPSTHLVMRVDGGPLEWWVVEVKNNSGQAAADLHLDFSGTGGSTFVPPGLVMTAGPCPPAAVASNGTPGSAVDIDWNAACVPPDTYVAFLMGTPTGPVSFNGGYWTDVNGQNIGTIAPDRVSLRAIGGGGGFPPPPKPFWAVKRQIRYIGNPVYSAWAKPPGQCWQRWCCFDVGQLCCFDRRILCFFPTRLARLLELIGPPFGGNCWRLTPWRLFAKNGNPVWILQVTTIPPPPWEPQNPPGGPPPQKPLFFALNEHELAQERLEVIESDDFGATSQASADFASSFFDVSNSLAIPTNDQSLPPILGFNNLCMAMAPRYTAAADALIPIELELLQLIGQQPLPEFQSMLVSVQGLEQDLRQISAGLATGHPTNPAPYFDAAARCNQLGATLLSASGNHPRYLHAQQTLADMAAGMQVSGSMVQTGLPAFGQQDTFLWGQVARFRPMAESFALATLPHVRATLDLQLPSWGPETGQVVCHVIGDGPDAMLAADALHVNERGHVYVSGFDLDGSSQAQYWFKGPTNLAAALTGPAADGSELPAMTLVNGDADGNNCVDSADLLFVQATMGQGGEFAPQVPSSDVNRDGFVDGQDESIVLAAMGACGALPPGACDGDLTGDGVVDGADLGLVIGHWGEAGPAGDANHDGIVDGADIGFVIGHWGPCPGG